MIIYSQGSHDSLERYGILIPIRDSKFRRTFAQLQAHPVLGPRQKEWHLEHAGQCITREDIRRAHTESYLQRLFSGALEQEIIRTGQPILNLEEADGVGHWALTTKMPLRDEKGEQPLSPRGHDHFEGASSEGPPR